MPRYCIDTSGLSNPLETMPEDIYTTPWSQVRTTIESGILCCNKESLEELQILNGEIRQCVINCAGQLCYEVGAGNWPWSDYIAHVERMRKQYESVISEYNGNRKNTVGLNDVSIVALGKTLGLPVIRMEKANTHQPSEKKMRIPDLCKSEGVAHLTFNEFLRAEGIRL